MEQVHSSNLDPSEVLELIKQVDDHRLDEQKNVVVFLGNTGAGKSTLVHFLYGEDSALSAEEVGQGTGVLTIVDQDNKIVEGIISKTFLVDFIIDNDTAYYDCPGFNDTRNANYDMAANYMVRKVLNGAERVKFVYVVNYSSVKDGTERTDFINLLKHASQSIKNIDNYANSIGLLVSKVENEVIWVAGVPQLVPENKIKSNIVEFLRKVKTTIETNPWFYQENNFGNIAIKILNVFLKRSNEDYKNVGLFRRPRETGILCAMPDMQESKQNISAMIERLEFSPSNINDFAFSISEASINNIHLMIGEIDQRVMNLMREMRKNVKLSLTAQMQDLDYFNLNTKISTLLPKFDDTLQTLKNATSMEDFVGKFLILLEEMKIKIDEKVYKDITNFCNFTKFVYEITNGRNFNLSFFEWSDQMNGIRDFLHEFTWNRFLRELYLQISVYKVYNSCSDIRSFGDINESSMQSFMDLIKSKIPNLTLTNLDLNMNKELKIKDLKHFLKIISEPASEIFSQETCILTIKAEFFCLSRLSALISSNSNVKEIRIYAYNTVYFDTDIQATGKQLKLIILAPTWEILGKKVIVLDGSSARNLYLMRADVDTDGRPGKPGDPAGSFLGLMDSVVNGHLEIRANGGAGGDGQDGGNGSPGQDAITVGEPMERIILRENIRTRTLMHVPVGTDTDTFYLMTWFGTKGKDGARGGVGGKGGYKGDIRIYGNYEGHVTRLSGDGANGEPGSGGEGGVGGKNQMIVSRISKSEMTAGDRLKFNLVSVVATALVILVIIFWETTVAKTLVIPAVCYIAKDAVGYIAKELRAKQIRGDDNERMQKERSSAPYGKKCVEISCEGLVEPQQAHLITNYDKILDEYKKFIHGKLDDKFRSENLRKINCINHSVSF